MYDSEPLHHKSVPKPKFSSKPLKRGNPSSDDAHGGHTTEPAALGKAYPFLLTGGHFSLGMDSMNQGAIAVVIKHSGLHTDL